jgi:tetrapyrrole methylase family protein/MazG family protein
MEAAGFEFEIIPAKGEEIIPENTPPEEVAVILAKQKAAEVFASDTEATVIGADTIVVIDGDILGKPSGKSEAFAMLRRLSGRKHNVFTGVAIYEQSGAESYCERTEVEFHELSDDEIEAYIETGEPFDKAGAYGIQEKGMLLVKRINGDFYNVMGLPVSRLSRILRGERKFADKTCGIGDLLDIMERLRAECPWDKEQTHESIRVNVIEEAYEVAEAIDLADSEQLCEELGDLLLQVVFHARIAQESGEYDFDKVCNCICRKLIYRHPHVFKKEGEVGVIDTGTVLRNWDDLKADSKNEETASDRIDGISGTLPALMRGEKVGKKAAAAGFDFSDVEETIKCLKNELKELELAILHNDSLQIEEEFGDVLFSCCNIGRFLKKDCEKALTFSTNRFIMRFRVLEDMVLKSGRTIEQLDSSQLDELWQASKQIVNSS